MKIQSLDHLVITTRNLDACLRFYVDLLGMELDRRNDRYALRFGDQKFIIHTKPAEFLPAAAYPKEGSLDLCLVVADDLEVVKQDVEFAGYPIELGIVDRTGALGPMRSLYLRDPDGNLVELCSYIS